MYNRLILSFSFVLISSLIVRADPPAPAATPSQAALLEVLKSNASLEQKAIACRQLAWVGNRDAVPVLAGLLTMRSSRTWPATHSNKSPIRRSKRRCARQCRS